MTPVINVLEPGTIADRMSNMEWNAANALRRSECQTMAGRHPCRPCTHTPTDTRSRTDGKAEMARYCYTLDDFEDEHATWLDPLERMVSYVMDVSVRLSAKVLILLVHSCL
jgi:hypothetical protein